MGEKKEFSALESFNSHQYLSCIFESKYILISQKPIQKWTRDQQSACLVWTRLI